MTTQDRKLIEVAKEKLSKITQEIDCILLNHPRFIEQFIKGCLKAKKTKKDIFYSITVSSDGKKVIISIHDRLNISDATPANYCPEYACRTIIELTGNDTDIDYLNITFEECILYPTTQFSLDRRHKAMALFAHEMNIFDAGGIEMIRAESFENNALFDYYPDIESIAFGRFDFADPKLRFPLYMVDNCINSYIHQQVYRRHSDDIILISYANRYIIGDSVVSEPLECCYWATVGTNPLDITCDKSFSPILDKNQSTDESKKRRTRFFGSELKDYIDKSKVVNPDGSYSFSAPEHIDPVTFSNSLAYFQKKIKPHVSPSKLQRALSLHSN